MNAHALTATTYYSGSPFPVSRERLVTCGAHLLSTVIGKETPMSSKQHRNLQANAADAEALESLQHMTSWAMQKAMRPATESQRSYGALIDGFALGATAFHPGPWALPIDAVAEVGLAEEVQPVAPGFATRAIRTVGVAMARAWRAFRHRHEIAVATRSLMEMDDRSLQDIGLSRADIGHAVRHGRDWERWR